MILQVHQRSKQNHKDEIRYWITRIFNLRLRSIEEIDSSSSSWKSTQRKWWSDWILEKQRQSSETFLVLSSLIWRKVEEKHDKRRRTKEKISVLYWIIRTKYSFTPSSSISFRTQSHGSYTSGQCVDSEQFLRVHLSYWMCGQLSLFHKFRIDTVRTKFEHKTDGILHVCGSNEQGT